MALKDTVLTAGRKVKHPLIPHDLLIEGYLLFPLNTSNIIVSEGCIEISSSILYKEEYSKIYNKVKQDEQKTDVCKLEFENLFIPSEAKMKDEEEQLNWGTYSNKTLPVKSYNFKYWFYDSSDKLSAFSNEVYVLCKFFDNEEIKFKYIVLKKEELYYK